MVGSGGLSRLRKWRSIASVVAAFAWVGCSGRRAIPNYTEQAATPPENNAVGHPRCAEFTESRRALFGDLHVHTAYSLDANLGGTRLLPRDAYRFARGEAVTPPGSDQSIRIDRPLDFAAVTDHAEFLGFVGACSDRDSSAYPRQACRRFRDRPKTSLFMESAQLTKNFMFRAPPRVCGRGRKACDAHRESMWLSLQAEAERAYDRTRRCRFTSFVGYEYSASPADNPVRVGTIHNMHRNVIFRNAIVPRVPVDFFDAPEVQDLWQQLAARCSGNQSGCDVLAIPHNANLSAGRMFEPRIRGGVRDGVQIDSDYATEQSVFEPLMEIYQHKGASECVPGQTSGDELCGFEVLPYNNLRSAKMDSIDDIEEVDTMRDGLGRGLQYQRALGVNPFQFGIIASTDGHLGLPGNVDERTFVGGGGAGESKQEEATVSFPDRVFFGPGGLAGVWAEENSRGSIFQALRRKETFGTSGPRIQLRSFGGWDLPPHWCRLPDAIERGYQRGIPMGGTLTAPPSPRAKPVFAIQAVADRGTPTHPGAKLQRLQIIKGYLDDAGEPQTRVFEVAGDPSVGTDLDLNTCEPSHEGFLRLCAVWRDDSFEPDREAYYYARAVEVPSCRWSTRRCVEHSFDCANPSRPIDEQCCAPSAGLYPEDCRAVVCDDDHLGSPCCQPGVVRPIIHERAWGSPIWYSPRER